MTTTSPDLAHPEATRALGRIGELLADTVRRGDNTVTVDAVLDAIHDDHNPGDHTASRGWKGQL